MNVILLSGGSGKRLWPLSNDVRSKQFIKIFRDDHGNYESMVQRIYRSIKRIDGGAKITVATSKTQVSELVSQLGKDIDISIEPERRDTFPAIALAVSYLHDVVKVPEDEAVVICPVDPYVEDDYFEALERLFELAKKGAANLALMGIEPTCPSDKYGYIMPESKDPVSKVTQFKEKPSVELAKGYIAQGALWNAGVFACKISYVLNKAHQLIGFKDYQDLFDKYQGISKISFDYAVAEKEQDIQVMRFSGEWKDIGTWDALTESMPDEHVGAVTLANGCENVKTINTLDVPLLCVGIKDAVVVASPEGILVSETKKSSSIKPIVEKFGSIIRFAEKSWGKYEVIDVADGAMTIKMTINGGSSLSYHSHEKRKEVWTVISGEGDVIVDGARRPVAQGDVIAIDANSPHAIKARTEMKILEVQIGHDLDAKDKRKYKLEC